MTTASSSSFSVTTPFTSRPLRSRTYFSAGAVGAAEAVGASAGSGGSWPGRAASPGADRATTTSTIFDWIMTAEAL